jgi:hypothetical protein
MNALPCILLLLLDAAPRVTIAVPITGSTVSQDGPGPRRRTARHIKTELYADGVLTASVVGPKAFSLTWDSTKAKRGPHMLTVRAYKAGHVGTASVQVHLRAEFDVRRYGAKATARRTTRRRLARKAGGTVYLPRWTYLIHPNSGLPFTVGSNIAPTGASPPQASTARCGSGTPSPHRKCCATSSPPT